MAIDLFFGVDTSANKSFPIANEWGGLLEQEKKKGAGNLKLLSKQQKGGGGERERKMFGFDQKRGTKRCLYASLLGLLYVYTHTRVTPTPEDVTCVSSDFWYS